ncbi:MAG: hypothetical protein ACYC6F_13260 [Longimicrobiales bacterium]
MRESAVVSFDIATHRMTLNVTRRRHSLGADAIIALRHVNEGGELTRDGYSGTAIRFNDEACMH